MPTSFDSLHDETRPLAMLGEPEPAPCGTRPWLAVAGTLLPVALVILAF